MTFNSGIIFHEKEKLEQICFRKQYKLNIISMKDDIRNLNMFSS